jgi:hypothetical protein
MGRFRDCWATGKYINKDRQTEAQHQEREAEHLILDLSPELAVPESAKDILAALRSRRGQETGKWLNNLASERTETKEQKAAVVSNVSSFDATIALMNALFKELGELTYEFNKTAVGSDLLISFDRPTLTEKKSDDVWYRPVTKISQGRLTTRQWALIVRGLDKKISIVLLPSAMVLAFTAGQGGEEEHAPFMEISHSADGTHWTIGGEVFHESTMPHLAKELFGDLVRVSSGVMSESELFSRNADKPKLGENLAVGYKPEEKNAVQQSGNPVTLNPQEIDIHDACDVVDGAVDRALKQAYTKASALAGDSPNAVVLRKQISALEVFRTKIMDAFEEYTSVSLSASSASPTDKDSREPVELLRPH